MNLLRKLLLERKGKRPPFLKAPLNAPGAFLQERLNDKVDSFAMGIVLGPAVLFIVAALTFLPKSRYSGIILVSILAVMWLVWLMFRGRNLQEEIRTTRMGYLGEVLVGQELERTRIRGCCVYHDIVDEKQKFNIDHVLIGEVGVLVFETKARAKPVKGDTSVKYQNGQLVFSDGRQSKAELDQAQRNGKHVQKLLLQLINDSNKASLQKFTQQHPLPLEICLVFPGWHVDYKSASGSEVNLSNDAMLFNFVSSQCAQKQRLSQKEADDLNEIFDTYLRKKKAHLIEV
jgi:hypothetical protein